VLKKRNKKMNTNQNSMKLYYTRKRYNYIYIMMNIEMKKYIRNEKTNKRYDNYRGRKKRGRKKRGIICQEII
jgi:hypothetical protein